MLALLAAAAVFSAPDPINADTWFQGFGGHPKEGSLTIIASEIIVDPKGKVESCRAVTILGEPSWAPFTCGLIRGSGRFHPAHVGGQPVYGVYRLRNGWVQSGYLSKNAPVWDLEFSVNRTPDGMKFPFLSKIQFVVNNAGQITDCAAQGDWNPGLAALACEALPKSIAVQAVKTKTGATVLSVQDAAVRFVTANVK